MKKILTIVIAAAMSLTLATSALAQQAGPRGGKQGGKPGGEAGQRGPGGGMRMGMGMSKEMMDKLNLSVDQRKKIEALNKKTQAELEKVRKDANGNREGMREKLQPILKAHGDELNKILTPQQRAKLDAMRKEMRGKRGDQPGVGGQAGKAGGKGGKAGAGGKGGKV